MQHKKQKHTQWSTVVNNVTFCNLSQWTRCTFGVIEHLVFWDYHPGIGNRGKVIKLGLWSVIYMVSVYKHLVLLLVLGPIVGHAARVGSWDETLLQNASLSQVRTHWVCWKCYGWGMCSTSWLAASMMSWWWCVLSCVDECTVHL